MVQALVKDVLFPKSAPEAAVPFHLPLTVKTTWVSQEPTLSPQSTGCHEQEQLSRILGGLLPWEQTFKWGKGLKLKVLLKSYWGEKHHL